MQIEYREKTAVTTTEPIYLSLTAYDYRKHDKTLQETLKSPKGKQFRHVIKQIGLDCHRFN